MEFEFARNKQVITYKAMYGMAPTYISGLITMKSKSNYSLRSNKDRGLYWNIQECVPRKRWEIEFSVWPPPNIEMFYLIQCVK